MAEIENMMENNEISALKTKAFAADLLAAVNIDGSIRDIISYIIKEVGEFTRSDTVCIYDAGTEQDSVNKVYQWNADDPAVDDERKKAMPEYGAEDWIDTLRTKKLVLIEDRDSIREKCPWSMKEWRSRAFARFLSSLYTPRAECRRVCA